MFKLNGQTSVNFRHFTNGNRFSEFLFVSLGERAQAQIQHAIDVFNSLTTKKADDKIFVCKFSKDLKSNSLRAPKKFK